jgi:hypothetical protein
MLDVVLDTSFRCGNEGDEGTEEKNETESSSDFRGSRLIKRRRRGLMLRRLSRVELSFR